MKQTIKIFVAAIAALFVGVSASAQIVTSNLNGQVTDNSGEPVIGAAVIATHTESGTVYAAATNVEGHYFINGMRAGGPYTVEVSCLGYQTVTYTGITLQLAETFSLNVVMPDDSEMLSEAIVISDAASKFAAEKTGA
ncbi:MAG: carboxypeptidase regulatory-like domain-containing protein, partial [Bacteroidales bacterium]|nr:carboxypeptidase regulatory-like domain-containing protein [Candidatus Cryptobacteroides caccocaballi]